MLGADRPDGQDCVDLRLTKQSRTGEPFVEWLEASRAKPPSAEKLILRLDNAKSSSKPVVGQCLAAYRECRSVSLPAYSHSHTMLSAGAPGTSGTDGDGLHGDH